MAKLFMDERGEVECDKHTPYKGSDTWTFGRWAPLSKHEAEMAKREGLTFKCETCGAHPA